MEKTASRAGQTTHELDGGGARELTHAARTRAGVACSNP